jgi:hypothetical protein
MYTEKLNKIMGQVQLFYSIFEFPQSSGKNFRTQFFNEKLTFQEFSHYFKSQSLDAYKFYQSVENSISSFKDALKEFVAQDNFLDKWENMCDEERKFLINFDEDSYIILRNKLPQESLIKIDWQEVMSEVNPLWNKDFSSILGLPEEFKNPPENRLQALKQKKALIQQGYNEEDIHPIFSSLEINRDLMAKQLLGLVTKKSDDLEVLCEKLKVSIPWWLSYNISFVKEQEKKLNDNSSGSKFKM